MTITNDATDDPNGDKNDPRLRELQVRSTPSQEVSVANQV